MSNVSNLAFPYDTHTGLPRHPGLTKREYFAAMAMSGVLANMTGAGISDIADFSVQCADALLARLEAE